MAVFTTSLIYNKGDSQEASVLDVFTAQDLNIYPPDYRQIYVKFLR